MKRVTLYITNRCYQLLLSGSKGKKGITKYWRSDSVGEKLHRNL